MSKRGLCVVWLAVASIVASGPAARGRERRPVLQAPAVAVPSLDVRVAAPVAGMVERVLMEEGDRVRAGQPLVALDSDLQKVAVQLAEGSLRAAEARIHAAEAQVHFARAEHERAGRLREHGAVERNTLDRLELELKQADAALVVAKQELLARRLELERERMLLERMTVRAPAAGVVVRCLKGVGEAVAEGEPVVRLVAPEVRHAVAHVSLALAARLRPGMSAELRLDDRPTVGHPCRVGRVDPVVDAATGKVRVALEVADREHKIAAGSKGTVSFHLKPPE